MKSADSWPPIGLRLARTARTVTAAFERAMAEAGGSRATWQVLLLLVRARKWGTQAEMAEVMGITGPTLTYHLKSLEERGLVRRWREDTNRRAQHASLTPAGEELFVRLRDAANRHDQRLRSLFTEDELDTLRELLDRLEQAK